MLTFSVSFLFIFREKAELGDIAAVKIKELTAELEANGSKPFNPDERIRSGFVSFKTEKFLYVFDFTVFRIIFALFGFVLTSYGIRKDSYS